MNYKNCKKQWCSLAGKDHEMSFDCKIRVVISPCDGMRWIVGYEGNAEEGE